MFEITPQDIAQLDDTQLRTLVGLLCEAELRKRGYSTAAVTWGGDQNAKDGGLDVRVSLADASQIDGFIPRRSTGFQVKKQDMPPRAIAGEMCPNGALRPVIHELAENCGAYVIVSSEGSTADAALTNRRRAMSVAVGELAHRLALDFYDRTRLASWVRSHAGLIIWVRSTVGRAIPGWEPFGAWSYPAGGTEAEYLFDKGVRVRARSANADSTLPADAGLKKLRDILRVAGSVVRLVGLSGVGKTRFVQALFDNRVGDNALDPTLAVYTNMNNDPSPQPFNLASDLIADGTHAILIVDNCPSDLHARLSQLVKPAVSSLNLLTIEYDIRDDQPEGTDVFEIQVASIELIENLLRKRFPGLSQIDAHTAAIFSGGNARVAIALADTVSRSGTLASLTDAQLFERLFMQRQGQDRSLMETAQACALVYSFDGEYLSEGDEGELAKIARLKGATAEQAYRDVAELLRRDLAQRRGKWRAVLPHALANRLAATALENIPTSRIQECLIDGAPERLTKSFSRRLGYLDNSPEAKTIVQEWFDHKGWIGSHVWNLNEFGKGLFQNCLPTNPEAGLRALEAGLPPHDTETPITTGDYIPRALRSMAWDPALFDRCIALLQVLAIYGDGSIAQEATKIHTSLFHLFLSGTHAPVEQRAAAVKKLLTSRNSHERGLGLFALDAMESTHFSSDYNFEFGAHSRDYGYQPKTYGEQADWYRAAFAIAEEVALSGEDAADGAKAAISTNFRGLWTVIGLRDELEAVSAKFAAHGFWRDGWLAVKTTRFYDEKDHESENYARLSKLEEMLRPRQLLQIVRGRVLAPKGGYDVEDIDVGNPDSYRLAMERNNEEAIELGAEVAADEEILTALMPEIVGGSGNLWHFGMGLARGTQNPRELWHRMVRQLALTPIQLRDVRAFRGLLQELSASKSELPDELLDQAVEDDLLAPYFPTLQTSVVSNAHGVARLCRALELGKASIHEYRNILIYPTPGLISDAEISTYLIKLSHLPDSQSVSIHALAMRFFRDRQLQRSHAPEIVTTGCEILMNLNYDHKNQQEDYELQIVVDACLAGDHGYTTAKVISENLKRAVAAHRTSGFEHHQLLKALFKIQPRALLDAFFRGDEEAIAIGISVIRQAALVEQTPASAMSEVELFAWCSEDPSTRFPIAASVIPAVTVSGDQIPVNWTPMAVRLVHSAPDSITVMRELIAQLRAMSWGGSRATLAEASMGLLDRFDAQGDAALAAYIAAQKDSFEKEARSYLEWETKLDSDRDERFE